MTGLPVKCLNTTIVAILIAAAWGCQLRPGPSKSGWYETSGQRTGFVVMEHDGITRTTILDYPAARPSLLLIALHGGGGSASYFRQHAGLSALTDSIPILIAYPQGTGRLPNRLLTWNSGDCCGYARDQETDDTGYLHALIDTLSARFGFQSESIWMTGHSNGGMMAYRFAQDYPASVRSVIPVAACMNQGELTASGSVSVLHVHGSADQHVLLEGGIGPESLVKQYRRPVSDGIMFWVRTNQLNPIPDSRETGQTMVQTWNREDGRYMVRLVTLLQQNHDWPLATHTQPGMPDLLLQWIRFQSSVRNPVENDYE